MMATETRRIHRQLVRVAAIAVLVAPFAFADDDVRELLVRLDHPVDASPVSINLADGAGLVAVGQQDERWRFSVVALADGAIISAGTIPDTVFFYDVGDPVGRRVDQLCFLDAPGVLALDPMSGTLERIAEFTSL